MSAPEAARPIGPPAAVEPTSEIADVDALVEPSEAITRQIDEVERDREPGGAGAASVPPRDEGGGTRDPPYRDADLEVVGRASEQLDELLDGGWFGVTAGDLRAAIDLLERLSQDELSAVVDRLGPDRRAALIGEVLTDRNLLRWRNVSPSDKQRLVDTLLSLDDRALSGLDRRQLADLVLPWLDRADRERIFEVADPRGIGRVVVEDAETGRRLEAGQMMTGIDEVDRLHDASAQFWEYLYVTFGRDSLDGEGGPMRAVGRRTDPQMSQFRAVWDPGAYESRFTVGWGVPSVVVHEFAHGLVDEITGGLETHDADGEQNVETLAVSEAIADMFAMNVTGSGVIGDDLPVEIRGRAPIRVPAAPERGDHPSHVDDFDVALGGHDNSTILSHAYHLLRDDVGQRRSEQILWGALAYLPNDAVMEDLRGAMRRAASERYGSGSPEARGVRDAFEQVGLDGSWSPRASAETEPPAGVRSLSAAGDEVDDRP